MQRRQWLCVRLMRRLMRRCTRQPREQFLCFLCVEMVLFLFPRPWGLEDRYFLNKIIHIADVIAFLWDFSHGLVNRDFTCKLDQLRTMLTKRDKLLVKPFMVERYNQHRKKVKSAGPRIDFSSPPIYPHVMVKMKKIQKENERKASIERENVRLLQKLGAIMNMSRLENFWNSTRPNFLNREFIYTPRRRSASKTASASSPVQQKQQRDVSGSAARCLACSGRISTKKNQIVPEERLPWAPPRKSWNQKILNDTTKPHICCRYCCWFFFNKRTKQI